MAPAIIANNYWLILSVPRHASQTERPELVEALYCAEPREAVQPISAPWDDLPGFKARALLVQRMTTDWGQLQSGHEQHRTRSGAREEALYVPGVNLVERTQSDALNGLLDRKTLQ